MRVVRIIIQWSLGLFMFGMGINKFYTFLPSMDLAEPAQNFMQALGATQYMVPTVGAIEMLCGVSLLFRATAPLGVLLLAPMSVNYILFHIFLDPTTSYFASFVFIANVALGALYFDHFRPIFATLLSEKVVIKDKSRPAKHSSPIAVVN